jgi:hypothetical protein
MPRSIEQNAVLPPCSRAKWENGTAGRALIIGLMAFLTVVDLFAAQAIVPWLAQHYEVAPAAMGLAVNSSTIGMTPQRQDLSVACPASIAGRQTAFTSRPIFSAASPGARSWASYSIGVDGLLVSVELDCRSPLPPTLPPRSIPLIPKPDQETKHNA